MSKYEKLLLKILRGTSDAHVPFEGLQNLLLHLKFTERIKGDHHIFSKVGVEEILNLQPKGYQVKQVRQILVKYRLGGIEDAEI